MSKFADARLAAFQQETGIVPVTGDRAKLLSDMRRLAQELLEAIPLEMAGIRAGHGMWIGSDPISGIAHEIALCQFMWVNGIYDRGVAETGTFPLMEPAEALALEG